ncbi:MAG: FAD-dependent oxidoreductase, partial [Mycobacteriales bacterium]
MTEKFDYVVVGAGALGSSAAYWLTRAGERSVLVLEQFEIGHNRGASEDHSRIIRHAYHSPVYTALTPAAYETWAQVEDESGLSLVTTTGGLDLAIAGTAGEAELDNYRNALDHARIGYDNLTADNVRDRWPQWQVGDDTVGMWQRDGGILDVRRACAVHLALARARGAVVRPHTAVHGIRSSDAGVMLATDAGEISAGYVVLCTASWLPDLLPDLGLTWNITLSQEQVCYFATSNLRDFAPDRFPMWIWHGEPLFYGFPVYGEVAVKAARDMTGRFVTQQTRSFEPDPAETTLVADFLRRRIPGA